MRDEVSLEFVRMIKEPAGELHKNNTYVIQDEATKPCHSGTHPQRGRQRSEQRRKQIHRQRREQMREQIRRRRVRRKRIRKVLSRICLFATIIGMAVWFWGVLWDNIGLKEVVNSFFEESVEGAKGNGIPHPEWTENFLTVNPYSRPGNKLPEVKDIFVHYTANPGTNAVQNRSYFEQLKDTHERAASSHFIIGYEGDILLCVPLNEVAYAVKTRNYDSMSIECCYINEDGSFTQETYDALIELLVWLLKEYDLTTDNILRHYDCGGKKCPLYYVENDEQWQQLKEDVAERLE